MNAKERSSQPGNDNGLFAFPRSPRAGIQNLLKICPGILSVPHRPLSKSIGFTGAAILNRYWLPGAAILD